MVAALVGKILSLDCYHWAPFRIYIIIPSAKNSLLKIKFDHCRTCCNSLLFMWIVWNTGTIKKSFG